MKALAASLKGECLCPLHPSKMGKMSNKKYQVEVVIEGGQFDVPWWFGLGWGGRAGGAFVILLHFLSLQSLCFMFSGGWGEFGWKAKNIGSIRKRFLVATAKGTASWAIEEQLWKVYWGWMYMFILGSCNVCAVCQSRAVTMLGESVQGLPSQCSCSLATGTRSSDQSSVHAAGIVFFICHNLIT